MSSSNPPNPNTPPVFNNDAFNFNTGDIDTAYLNANYLRFPTAQGSETLQNIQVVGSASFTNASLPTSSGVIPASNDSSTKIPTTAWVQSAITGGSSNTLTDVLIAGNNAGASDIDMNNNDINSIGILNVGGGINQTDSNYVNSTTSTGSFTQVSGGSVQNVAGSTSGILTYNKLIMGDSASGVNEVAIDKSSITYTNDTGSADQLIISSNTTDNPILIQSNASSFGGGGIILEATTAGADILLQTTSQASPTTTPSNITLSTSASNAVLGVQSSIILQTDNVFVNNGSLHIQNNPSNYTTGLVLYQATANNFRVSTNYAGATLTLGTTISNIVCSTTDTTISIPLTPTYSGSSPTSSQIGYTINTNLSGTAVLPPTANVAANMNAGFVIPNGIWFVSIIAEINYTVVGATTSYFALSLSQSSGNMDAQNRSDFVAGLRTGDIFFNFPLIVNSTGGTYYIVGVQQGGTKTLDTLNYKITRIA